MQRTHYHYFTLTTDYVCVELSRTSLRRVPPNCQFTIPTTPFLIIYQTERTQVLVKIIKNHAIISRMSAVKNARQFIAVWNLSSISKATNDRKSFA